MMSEQSAPKLQEVVAALPRRSDGSFFPKYLGLEDDGREEQGDGPNLLKLLATGEIDAEDLIPQPGAEVVEIDPKWVGDTVKPSPPSSPSRDAT